MKRPERDSLGGHRASGEVAGATFGAGEFLCVSAGPEAGGGCVMTPSRSGSGSSGTVLRDSLQAQSRPCRSQRFASTSQRP